MSFIKSIKKRYNWLTKIRYDKRTGFFVYKRFGKNIYIRHPRHFMDEKSNIWYCDHVVYSHYKPVQGDVVIDLGAGYGEEAIYLIRNGETGIRYIGVEAQPVIYECLANTFNDSGEDFTAVPFAISDKLSLKFVSQMSYASVGETPEAYVEVPTISWPDFLERYQIDKIDLLKMNIEGAEKEVLKLITDFSIIKRLAISCHDFRADEGDGEWYRSKEIVTKILKDNGYLLRTINLGIPYTDDWIFAERD